MGSAKLVNKPLLVFATPRSGSTLVYDLLAEYERQARQTLPLGEYFTMGRFFFVTMGAASAALNFPCPKASKIFP